MNNNKAVITVFAIIVILSLIVRFYNFTERINFGHEQAVSLSVSADYIQEKPSLLGLPSVRRTTSLGHTIYFGPWFNYSLVPLLLLSHYDPVGVTAFFPLLNVATGILIFFFASRFWNTSVALFASLLFLFNTAMINHSLYIWIVHYMPLIGILSFASLYSFWKTRTPVYALTAGLLTGIAFNLEYLYLPTAILVCIIIAFLSRKKIQTIALFLAGGVLGNTPTILFDMRHNFYHVRTIWQYLLDTLHTPGQDGFSPYHFLQFWPIFALLGGLLLAYIYNKKSKLLALSLSLLYVLINLLSPEISFTGAIGMPDGLHYPAVQEAVRVISSDHPSEFNVMAYYNNRAYDLRYLLTYRYGVTPQKVEEYGKSRMLYAFVPIGYDFQKSNVWEINVFQAKKVELLKQITSTHGVYKLTK
ncbi:MAG TPA: hypothetical protein VJ179_03535 [Patescibacteria group bacterium]|nr:hypothetical protein [Patescibacteria group bacterium]